MCTRVGFRSKLKAQISSRNMHKYKKKRLNGKIPRPFFIFRLRQDGFFKIFFSIFENLSLVGSKNRKLNCSGLRADKKYNTQKNPVCFLRPKKIKVFFTDPKKNPFDQNFRPEKFLWTLPPPPPPSPIIKTCEWSSWEIIFILIEDVF